jgi:hypothetical protein
MCLSPIRAELSPEGGRPVLNPEGNLKLPCGKCHICISRRAIDWATRARHEMSLHDENSFITLTYNNENLNSDFIIKRDFQLFMKKLRKKTNKKIRYMVSYEYGSQFFRPHMHAILFGHDPKDQSYLMNSPSGSQLYTSSEIDKLWTNKDGDSMGYHSVGEACEETAYYIASYALKGKEREIFHPETGESVEIRDQMNVSVRPAIGLKFFEKNYEQMLDTESVLPRYYQKKLEEIDPIAFEHYQDNVQSKLKGRSDYENYSKLIINNAKSSLHSATFRADYENTNENNREVKRRKFLERRLKELKNDYAFLKKGEKNAKNVYN